MESETLHRLLPLYKLFLDEERLKILGSVAHQAATVQGLSHALDLKEKLVSRHVTKLVEAGLVRAYGKDNQTWYELNLDYLHGLKKEMVALEGVTPAAPEDENEAGKVLRSYLEGERLTQIPAKHTKRMVILAWLAEKFEMGAKYPEKTINEMLKQYHPDCATLRRALVDHGFMQRAEGIYWRLET